jgi:alpha-galactosidase
MQRRSTLVHRAIIRCGRPIVLSPSPGRAPLDKVANLRANVQMWRIEDHLWDDWSSLKNTEGRIESWYALAQPGGWPDADMLPLGLRSIEEKAGVITSRAAIFAE